MARTSISQPNEVLARLATPSGSSPKPAPAQTPLPAMAFVSYAQNLEDVMLWRALHHVDAGFYIDVGAWSPDVDSVTRAFSERGWRGINVEPSPHYFNQLVERRPADIN